MGNLFGKRQAALPPVTEQDQAILVNNFFSLRFLFSRIEDFRCYAFIYEKIKLDFYLM